MKAIMNYLVKERNENQEQATLLIKIGLMIILAFAFKPLASLLGGTAAFVIAATGAAAIFLYGEFYIKD